MRRGGRANFKEAKQQAASPAARERDDIPDRDRIVVDSKRRGQRTVLNRAGREAALC